MKHSLVLLSFVLAIGAASAQDKTIAVRGNVTDAKTKEPLPGVTVVIEKSNIFTQTNGDGTFVIKVPEKMMGGNIVFSMFGYSRDTIAVKKVQKSPKVKLKTGGAIKLNEVVVTEYTPQTLVKEAVSRIPQNFWNDTTIGTFFYRDVRQLNDEIYLFDEMVFDALRVGYDKYNTSTKTHEGGQRIIKSNYKAILFSRLLVNDIAYIKERTKGGGDFYLTYSDNDVMEDPVEMPNATYLSTSKRSLKSWKYKTESFTDPENADYYLVTMTKNDPTFGSSENTVVLTIRKSNLAITKLEYIHDSKENDYPWPMNKLSQKVGRDSIYYYDRHIYNYGEIDGKMTLTSFTQHNTATFFYSSDTICGQREQHFEYDVQCVLTSQRRGDASFFDENSIQSPVRIAVSDRQARNVSYDEDFWNQYNYVPVEAALQEKLEKKLGK